MRSSQIKYLLELTTLVCLVCSSGLIAQTFDNPDSQIEGGLEVEAAEEAVSEAELDEALEEYLEEPQSEEEQVSEGGEFDSFIPSEDISEDYSVPFPVDI